jgi:pimeloyl-ACP methyl ester carboxylesterase
MKIERRYVSVDGRRVHYRRAGAGPPVVMMHGSPGDSAILHGEMQAASAEFTCIALDTPGFGESEPLPGNVLTVRDLAEATAAAMRALELPPCRVYGTHTGAAIGVELGLGWPEQVSGLVLEGLPVFTESEIEVLFNGYFAPMIPDPLGGHLTATWMRFRDQFTWFPWLSRDVARLNPVDRPTPEEIDEWVSMFYRSCRTYGPAYKAACNYGYGAYRAAEASRTPTIYMASAEDMLFPHLDRLPPLAAGQRIERLAYDPEAKFQAIRRFLASLPGGWEPPPPPRSELAGSDPAKGFIAAPQGQVFVRTYGAPAARAVVLLHDAPGTGLALEGLARRLAHEAFVVLPDLPGCGETPSASDEAEGSLDASADAVQAVMQVLNVTQTVVGAVGCGGAVAGTLAGRSDARFTGIVVESPLRPDPAAAAALAPDLPMTPEGGHWVKAWLMVRDAQIYRPWYDGRVAAQRTRQGNFDADWLHDQTVALMKSRATYHQLPHAAVNFDIEAALQAFAQPVRFAPDGGLETAILSLLQSEACR